MKATVGLLASIFAAPALWHSVGGVGGQPLPRQARPGRALYTTYCRSCHGPDGRGDGIIRDYLRLPPTDLTRLAQRNKGVFPAEHVRRIIDGRDPVRSHGESQMPVWGDAFSEVPDPRERIDALVSHLKSIQDFR